MNPFWIGGGLLFAWALVLAFGLGLRSEEFPRNERQARAVMGISIVLTVIAMSTAIIGGISGAGADVGLRDGPPEAEHE